MEPVQRFSFVCLASGNLETQSITLDGWLGAGKLIRIDAFQSQCQLVLRPSDKALGW